MSEEKELKKGNGEKTEKNEAAESVEGYEYCRTHRAMCLNDCGGGGQATPTMSDLH